MSGDLEVEANGEPGEPDSVLRDEKAGGAHKRQPTQSTKSDLRAAGGIVWRRRGRRLEVVLIHRPRYDDWSFPKGKIKENEDLRTCAIREITEETQLNVALSRPAGTIRYRLANGLLKEVTYWVCHELESSHPALKARPKIKPASKNEIDQVLWVPLSEAMVMLTSEQDREVLGRVVDMWSDGKLDTTPVILVRHARAVKRSNWQKGKGTEETRPLTARGKEQAKVIARQLDAYGARQVTSSPWLRCMDTLQPYADAAHLRIIERPELTEHAYSKHKKPVARAVRDLIREAQETVVVCLHRPTLPSVFKSVSDRSPNGLSKKIPAKDPYLKTGELFVAHVAHPYGRAAQVVAVEQYRPTTR
ncbi:NUDIX hydrolase [Ancrocorticia populi]|uniref:NUDIX hydrolase n=3 Tax=Ancrocorticia populi TaxID=2175228 RepID=UPI002704E718|nr:NUDIX hydrolase [Ancrocorticia sp.]